MRIAVLISGGVDSSIALYKMRRYSKQIVAYFIKVWSENDIHFSASCPWQDDLHYAQLICNTFDIPLRVVSLQRQYREIIIAYTLSELKRGGTPSPDIFCNSKIKFDAFLNAIDEQVDCIVSGHYARVKHQRNLSYLLCARDKQKDQTYFLSHLSQTQLQKIHTPLGAYSSKEHIRHLARKMNLPNAGRPDSQGLCFLGTVRYRDFIANYLSQKVGDIIDIASGAVKGHHNGVWFYTIGQRQGLGLSKGPWYVIQKDIARNIIFVTKDYALLARRVLIVDDLVINIPIHAKRLQNGDTLRCKVKIRHGPEYNLATIRRIDENRYQICMQSDVYAIAMGQRVALYIHRYCIGGGRIVS